MPTIGELIREALTAGRSVRDLEQDSGYLVKYQTFQELSARTPREFPKQTKTITGMAQALRITETAVVLAYAESLGIRVEARSGFAMRLPAGVDQLDIEMQNALIAVVRAAARPALNGSATAREEPKKPPRRPLDIRRTAPGQGSGVRGDEQGREGGEFSGGEVI